MARTKKAPAKLTAGNTDDFTITNPVYGGMRFNSACMLEYTVDMEQKVVLLRVTDELNNKTYNGSAELSEVE